MPGPVSEWATDWEHNKTAKRADVATEVQRELKKGKKKRPAYKEAIGPNNRSLGTVEAMVEYLRTPPAKRDPSMLDEIIYNNGLDAVPFTKIAEEVGLTVGEVRKRFLEMLEAQNTFSQAEMKLMLTAQIQRVINMMVELASKGSEKHAQIILVAIERLQKMYDLESAKANIIIEIITVEQTNVIITAMGYLIEKMKEAPEFQSIDAEVYEQIAAQSLGEASALVFEAADREVVLDSKGERVTE